MNKAINIVVFLLFLSITLNGYTQSKETTLLTVGDDTVSVDEFLRVYEKNLDLVKDESQKNIDDYLELFINYQLKLQEAKHLKLNESKTYLNDYERYKTQLTNNYITESEVTSKLVKEAYERMKFDVKAIHILIKADAKDQDTLGVYNKLLGYRKDLINNGFEETKAKLHNGQTVFVEDLGYFSSFKMVYDFESAAYNTLVGTVSMPFKTDFGYHVVYVTDKRPSRGTITAAHIMVLHQQKDSTINPEARINDIYKKLQKGESFDALAKQFSDDKGSARNGGKLRPFKSGQLNSEIFENAAFALKNDGDMSEPIKTENGWHIIKRIQKKPIPDFEDAKPALEAQIKRDARSKLINSAMASKLMQRYKVSLNPNTETYLRTVIDADYFSKQNPLPQDFKADDYVLRINDSVYTNSDFMKHFNMARRKYMRKKVPVDQMIADELESFKEKCLLNYRKEHLEFEDKDFAHILKEYRDGLLLFDLMEKQIWNKAAKDTVGLKAFYQANASNYRYDDRVNIKMVSTKSEAVAKKINEALRSGKSEEEIKQTFSNNDETILFTNGVFSTDDSKFPKDLTFKIGIQPVFQHNDNYHSLEIIEVLPSEIKPFDQTKGAVINDYQDKIESDWILGLKKKYKVEVNRDALQAIKKKLNQ